MNTTLQDTREAQALWNRKLSGRARERISLTCGHRDGFGAKLSRAIQAMAQLIDNGLPVAAYREVTPIVKATNG